MSAENKLAPKDERLVEFVPVGCTDKIKLSVRIVQNLVAVPTRSGKTCSERDALKFIMLCAARKLNPFEGDAFLVGFDGANGPEFSLITAHQALMKRAEVHPEFDGMESGIIVKDGEALRDLEGDFHTEEQELLGGWAKVFFKSRRHPSTERCSLRNFIKTTKDGTPTKFWKENPSGMICKCFDPETEVLTMRGFQRFDSVNAPILQVTPGGLEATTAEPFSQKYNGAMVRLENQNLDFCVTPNHDMITDRGRVEAGEILRRATFRNMWRVPRIASNLRPDADIADCEIELAAAFLADGYAQDYGRACIAVSRKRKIERLDSIGGWISRCIRKCAGDSATFQSGRHVVTRSDKVLYRFKLSRIARLIADDKACRSQTILALSSRQARLFVDTLVFFDGHITENGTVRFYSSRPGIVEAFELAAVVAGYSVSGRTVRNGDGSSRSNIALTISGRNEIPISPYGQKPGRPLPLREVQNEAGKVWCVTVPSGQIVVRRNGFSFVCGNCAEASALRKAFPTMCGGLYLREEIGEGDTLGLLPTPAIDAQEPKGNEDVKSASSGSDTGRSAGESVDSPQAMLAALAQENGLSFDAYQRWGQETGNDKEAGSRTDWSEIPDELAKRLLRVKPQLIAGLKKFEKGGGQ